MLTTHLNKIILCVLLVLQSTPPVEASAPGALLASILTPEPVGLIVGGAVTVCYCYAAHKIHDIDPRATSALLAAWSILEECRGANFYNPWSYPVAIGKGACAYFGENPTTFAVAGTCIAFGYFLYQYKTSKQAKLLTSYVAGTGSATKNVTDCVVKRLNIYRQALSTVGLSGEIIDSNDATKITAALGYITYTEVCKALEPVQKELSRANTTLQDKVTMIETLRATYSSILRDYQAEKVKSSTTLQDKVTMIETLRATYSSILRDYQAEKVKSRRLNEEIQKLQAQLVAHEQPGGPLTGPVARDDYSCPREEYQERGRKNPSAPPSRSPPQHFPTSAYDQAQSWN